MCSKPQYGLKRTPAYAASRICAERKKLPLPTRTLTDVILEYSGTSQATPNGRMYSDAQPRRHHYDPRVQLNTCCFALLLLHFTSHTININTVIARPHHGAQIVHMNRCDIAPIDLHEGDQRLGQGREQPTGLRSDTITRAHSLESEACAN
eukprot:2962812-Amphidinium_carterae.1